MTDYYRLLQVRRDASAEVISAAYRRLMRDAHPDRGGDAEYARWLNLAYETLSDAASRTAYDRELRAGVPEPKDDSRLDGLARRLGAAIGTQLVRVRRIAREVRDDLSS